MKSIIDQLGISWTWTGNYDLFATVAFVVGVIVVAILIGKRK